MFIGYAIYGIAYIIIYIYTKPSTLYYYLSLLQSRIDQTIKLTFRYKKIKLKKRKKKKNFLKRQGPCTKVVIATYCILSGYKQIAAQGTKTTLKGFNPSHLLPQH